MPLSLLPTRLGLQAKVLIPVVSIMVLLVALAMWVVNRRISRQLEREASQSLLTAEAVFKNTLSIRAKNLLLRFRNLPNEPRYRAVFQTAEPKTVRHFLDELLREELEGELLQYKTADGRLIANARSSAALDLEEFQTRSAKSVEMALEGDGYVDTIRVSRRLFDVVSVPVTFGGTTVGALTVGMEIGESEASDLSQNTHCGVVLFAENTVAAASLQRGDLFQQCLAFFGSAPTSTSAAAADSSATIRNIALSKEHFLGLTGKFSSLSGDPGLGYVLLYSSEPARRELRATQRTIIAVSFCGILLSTCIVWWLVRRVTAPLRKLRDSAEAVGQGDFSRRVEVASRDECGELAGVFNRMTENLKSSHAQLEKTVVTLKSTQAQLVQSEKLAGIGEFVAGVTHELNNPLTGVIGFAELLQASEVNERQRRFLDSIVASAQRCHKIVQNLLSFARQHKPEQKPVKIHELVQATLNILQYQLRTSNIQVTTQFEPGLPKIMADPHQLQQVFLNLLNNARQAIEAFRPKGAIRIITEKIDDRVRVRFQDDGPGISPENLAKIFNPFFTTKEVGKGTGLGLSLSYGIIKEHGGTIAVQSEQGRGATFIIELPVNSEAAAAGTTFLTRTDSLRLQGAGKRALVVDDEESILELVRETLTEHGFHLDVAGDGEAALRQLRESDYDLTVCDWKMPGLNGQQVYEQLHAFNPNAAARMIFITGDVVNQSTQDFFRKNGNVCLPKPFSLDDFRAAVEKVLNAA